MKNFLLLLLIFYQFSFSQNFEWAKNFGSINNDSNQVVEVDDNGNSYTLGNYSGTIDCDPSANTFNLTAAGLNDIFLVKLDINGNFVWAKNFGGTGADDGIAIKIDNNGDIVIGGKFKGTSDFDPNTGVTNLTSNVTTTFDIFVFKLTSQGELVWAKSVGSSLDDFLEDLAIDANNNIYSTGQFNNIVDFDPSSAIANVGTSMKSSTFIWKLTSSGTYVWAKHITSSIGYAITLTNTGVFFTGDFTGTNIDFNPSTTATANLTTPNSFSNCYIARFDTSGNYVWAKKFGNATQTNSYSRGFTINTDSNSNVFVGGEFGITTDFNPDATNVFNLTPANSNKDAFICKLNSSGIFVDAFKIGGSNNDVLNSIEIDKLNNIYLTGYFAGANVDFNPGTATFNLSTTTINMFIAKYTNTLNFIWAYKIGDTYSCEGQNLKVTKDLDIFTSGTYFETADFDISSNTSNLTSVGQRDVFILKLTQCPKVTSTILTQTNASCGNNGSATVSASGGTSFTYSWAPSGGTNATATNLAPNNYTCTITNECGNSVTQNVTILSETQTTIWNGTSWTNGTPDASKSVIFNADYTIATNMQACSLTVNNADILLSTGITLNVTNEISVDPNSTFVSESGAIILQTNPTAVNTGNITVNRNSAPMIRLDYTAWSTPVSGQNLLNFSPNTITSRFYTYNPSGTGSWVSITPSSNNFTAGNGFLIRVANNWDTTNASAFPGIFTGVLNNGTITNNASIGNNFVGNPYPSPLNANTFLEDNTSIGASTLYFWTHAVPQNGGYTTQSNYAAYIKNVGGVAAVAGGLTPDGIIQVGQGFFHNATSAGNTTFNNTQRLATSNNQFFRVNESNSVERHRIWLSLTDESNAYNELLVAYMTGASNEVDNTYDGKLFTNAPSNLSSLINNEKYVIQTRGLPFVDSDEVLLSFVAHETTNYTISLTNFDGLFTNQIVYLHDKYNNVYHNLKLSNFTFNAIQGTHNNRFSIVYTNQVLSQEDFTPSNIHVYSKKSDHTIQFSAKENIEEINIFDLSGRLLFSKSNINAKTFYITNNFYSNVLLVKTTTEQGQVLTKKIMN
jgi:hypothetical protein